MISFRRISTAEQSEYQKLVDSGKNLTIHHSGKFRNLLRGTLPEAEEYYFGAFDGTELVMAMPGFVLGGPRGGVYNSLPFFGSHGGIVTSPDIRGSAIPNEVEFIENLTRTLETQNLLAGTVVEPLVGTTKTPYYQSGWSVSDRRLGQITELPSVSDHLELEEQLLSLFHPKRRWDIRKGLRSGFQITHGDSDYSWDRLREMHELGMRRIGGTPKPQSMYTSIRENLIYDLDFRLYMANINDEPAASLLLLYFGDTVEYFVPAISENFRSLQPLSALIFSAMIDSVRERSMKFWNWGGTWLSQDGVYRFKSKWGAVDSEYRYLTKVFDENALSSAVEGDLREEYPYFYVYPYSKNKSN